jgi:hypothetical protein
MLPRGGKEGTVTIAAALLKAKFSLRKGGSCQLSVREPGGGEVVFRVSRTVKSVAADRKTRPDVLNYWTQKFLRFMGGGGDPVSLMSCLAVIARDCSSIDELMEEI